MNKSSLWISCAAALAAAFVLAGCGSTEYVDGRTLPPSGLLYRVMIAVQNPSALTKGELAIVDAYYDERSAYNGTPGSFAINSFGGQIPITIQNMPEEQIGAVYSSGDGSLANVNYQKESATTVSGLNGLSSSIFLTRNEAWVFAASQAAHVFTVGSPGGSSLPLSLPGIYRVSTNPGGTIALAFVQNSNYAYYPRTLSVAQSQAYSGGPTTWPTAAVDCEPQAAPNWCLFQMQSPDHVDATGNYYGAPLVFDRPVKALYSNDGSTVYILNCGPECGGNVSSVSILPLSPLIFSVGLSSGLLPCNTGAAACANTAAKPMITIPVPGGASNGLVNGSTMYLVGLAPNVISGQTYYGGNLSLLNLSTNAVTSTTAITDGQPGFMTRMIEGDDNTLWIAMSGCTNGLRAEEGLPVGCLTMYNTSSNTVTMIEPYLGDATGLAAVLGLHKLYTAEGGQVYIYSTIDGSALDNQYVTVTGTAWDVAYMDATTDADNTVY